MKMEEKTKQKQGGSGLGATIKMNVNKIESRRDTL